MTATRARRDLLKALSGAAALASLSMVARPVLSQTNDAKTGGTAGNEALSLGPPKPFVFEDLVAAARESASKPYEPVPPPAPEVTERIDYSEHGAIRFPPEKAMFKTGEAHYPATFFHLGKWFPTPVNMHVLVDGMAHEVLYRSDYFDAPDDNPAHDMPDGSGFAGFRLHEDKARADWKTQDWIAFLGASYFRAIGDEGQYGLSARALAIDTAIGGPEEFPAFTNVYIQPARGENDPVRIHATVEGPSVAGACRFDLFRTSGVEVDVDIRLFFRQPVERLGIAPLTSMYWFSETISGAADDWRPEVHDSDGLSLWTGGGERIWRPLNNPPRTTVSSFLDSGPRGFGLLQRDRRVLHYLDGVRYHRRPSLWIEPHSDWGAGSVQLVEIPTDDEIHDNIVAFWVPEERIERGSEARFGYRMYWYAEPPHQADALGRCVATRLGRGGEPGRKRPKGVRKFVIDFAGGPIGDLKGDAPVEVAIEASRGGVSYIFTEPVPEVPRWRAQFDLHLDDAGQATEPVDLRAYLHIDGEPITETWLYQYWPEEVSG
ncbi:glucan biosynthesis protein D [Marivibrio halodurans]|uniref:Glucan biosynthesis protein D n=1 Tax=Marivibrio halodurans TaxID=2039722 RepID=A0A8J7S4U6_9PROT|nr:glucan biosynthesis protein D [Marivibrio halodurans]MBP5858568.1 glucan biosynthesis protein D [Marivibrio halodurans]